MTRKIQLVRVVGSCLVLLGGAFFCHEFSVMQLEALVHGAGYPVAHLPAVCVWFARYSTWLMLLPPAILWVAARRLVRERQPSAVVEFFGQAALVLGVILVLGCILAWQLPYLQLQGELF